METVLVTVSFGVVLARWQGLGILSLAQLARLEDDRVTMAALILFAAFMREGRLWR